MLVPLNVQWKESDHSTYLKKINVTIQGVGFSKPLKLYFFHSMISHQKRMELTLFELREQKATDIFYC